MKRTVTTISVAILALVIAFSAFLATRHPVSGATVAPSPLLGKRAPTLKFDESSRSKPSSTREVDTPTPPATRLPTPG